MKIRNRHIQVRTFYFILMLLVAVLLPSSFCSAAATGETHYLAFGSDRHEDTTAVSETMSRMPESTEYVGLIGDMVNQTWNQTNVSVLVDEVHAVLPSAAVQNIYGGHDYWMKTEGTEGVMMCKGPGSSGLVYEGKNSDGSVAYHIWGISYDDLTYNNYTYGRSDSRTVTGTLTAQELVGRAETAAANFRSQVDSWNDAGDQAPVIVLSHAPLHCARGDNLGAYAWNAALNYAATGQTDGSGDIIRNVIFMHGHNHTTEALLSDGGEYYLEPGSRIILQKPEYSVEYESAFTSESALQEVQAQLGSEAAIQYTYLTPGYLNANNHASLIKIGNTTIDIAKYDGDTQSIVLNKTIARVHTHQYGEPVWTWSGTEAATATFTCKDGDDTQIVDATVTSETTQTGSEGCSAVTYTATVTFAGETYQNSKVLVVSDTGISYKEPVVTWADDHSSVALTFTSEDGTLSETVSSDQITQTRTEAGCVTDGSIVYSATVLFKGISYPVSKKEIIPAAGHDWEVTFTWNQKTSATAVRTCKRDPSHQESVEAEITSEITKAPTQSSAGIRTYTATAVFSDAVYTDTKTSEISSISDTHYLAFLSDLGQNDSSSSRTALSGMPSAVEYVNIVGGSNPYSSDSSGVSTAIAELFSSAQVQLTQGDTSDNSETGIQSVCGGTGSSGLIYTGRNSDGSAAYYVYGISCADMTDASNAASAAGAFVSWCASLPSGTVPTPVFVVSHAPMHYHDSCQDWAHSNCNTSAGAPYWNEALNLAATGNKEASGSLIRNVVFLHGHNTSEVISWNNKTGEYYYAPGSTMPVQGSSQGTYEEKTVGYTYLTAGYAREAYNAALLVTLDGSRISFRRYHSGSSVSELGSQEVIVHDVGEDHIHTYGDPEYEWSDDMSEVTAIFTCTEGDDVQSVTETTTEVITLAATCTEPGTATYTADIVFNEKTYKAETTKEIPALGHDWGTPEYVWAQDNVTVTATCVCSRNEEHTVSETAETTYEVIEEATENKEGTGTYTAVFENELFTTQTKEVTIPVVVYDWEEPSYIWSEDNATVTATKVCKSDATKTKTETVTSSYTVTTAATCEAAGTGRYTAEFTDAAFETQVKDVEIESTGHDWGEPEYIWAADNSSVTVTMVCSNNAEHKVTETVNTTYKVTKAATCEETGTGAYTAAFTNSAFTTQTKEVTIAATGHDWNNPEYEWANDRSSVTATMVCKNNAEHKVTETVNTTYKVTKEATCEETGTGRYTAGFTDAVFETQTKDVEIEATGHDWGEPEYIWAADNSSVTATMVCSNNVEHKVTETVNTTYKVTKEAGPETDGVGTYTAAFEKEPFSTQIKQVAIPATGYQWEEPSYNWSEDNTTVTASRVCKNDETKTKTETVTTTYKVTKAATCEETGTGRYTAEFTDAAFETQVKDVELGATGHSWNKPEYIWAADNSSVTATMVCSNDAEHKVTETVDTTYKVTKEATCEETGTGVYKAAFTNSAFSTQTKEVMIESTGHDWGEPVYAWAQDNKSVTATMVCSNNAEHKVTETVNTTYKVTKEATCEETGTGVYKAAFTNGAFSTQTKEVTIAATGHDWNNPEYEWANDHSSVTATMICNNNAEHKVTETVNTTYEVTKEATCEETGTGVYTAAFTNSVFSTQTKEVTIGAIGHSWGDPVYTWAQDNKSVTATMVCSNNAEHKVTETVNTTYKVTKEAGPETDGTGTYTAVFEKEPFSTQTKQVAIPAMGYQWEDAEYVWADDNSTVTATMVCTNDETRTKIEIVSPSFTVLTKATCQKEGTGLYTAAFSNKAFSTQTKEATIPVSGHTWNAGVITTKPTTTTEGVKTYTCAVCRATKTEPVAKLTSGNQTEQNVPEPDPTLGTVSDLSAKAKALSENGDPAGSAYYRLQLKVKSVKKTSIKIAWKSVPNAAGYVVYGARCGSKFDKLTEVSGKSFTQKKLKKGTYYKYFVSAYDKYGNILASSKAIHVATSGGKVGNPKSVRLNKKKVTLSKGKSFKLKAVIKKGKLKVKTHRKICYETTNKNIATVTGKGKIKAVGRGTCYVYAYAQNGVCAKIKVIVK